MLIVWHKVITIMDIIVIRQDLITKIYLNRASNVFYCLMHFKTKRLMQHQSECKTREQVLLGIIVCQSAELQSETFSSYGIATLYHKTVGNVSMDKINVHENRKQSLTEDKNDISNVQHAACRRIRNGKCRWNDHENVLMQQTMTQTLISVTLSVGRRLWIPIEQKHHNILLVYIRGHDVAWLAPFLRVIRCLMSLQMQMMFWRKKNTQLL